MRVVTAAEIREIDRRAEEEFAIPRRRLMEEAGRWVAHVVVHHITAAGRRCAVMAGKGSNGGDGLVAARYLLGAGWDVDVALLTAQEEIGGEPGRNLDLARAAGANVLALDGDVAAAGRMLRDADVIIDAIFGTGFRGVPGAPARGVIEAMNAAGAPVVAIDIPSGVDADSGATPGAAVAAVATVTMGLPKPGLLLYPGAALAGRLFVADIGYPARLVEDAPLPTSLVMPDMVARVLPPRPLDIHKGAAGRVLICAGSVGFTGAPSLCALGALRAGAGLVSLAVPQAIYGVVAPREVEAMPHPLPDAEGAVSDGAWEALATLLAQADVVALGPGLSRRAAVGRLVRRLLGESSVPLVLDADALNVLAGEAEALARAPAPTIITPHPGEMGRLLAVDTSAVQRDRLGSARDAARRTGAVVVLKGARTIVADPEGEAFIIPTGNPGMATGGMGDVLTGVIAALLAQNLPPLVAAWAGAYLHGLAGDLVAERLGDAGLLAREVADAVPLARRAVRDPSRPGPLTVLP